MRSETFPWAARWGQTTSAAFGLALGLPDEKVVLFDAEGSLLMNLGGHRFDSGEEARQLLSLPARQRVLRHHWRTARAELPGD